MLSKDKITEKENMLLCINGQRPAWVPSYYDATAVVGPPAIFSERTLNANGNQVDIFGNEYISQKDGAVPLSNITQEFRLKNVSEWREIMPHINLSSIDWESEAREINSHLPNDKLLVYNGGHAWEHLHLLMGFEEALVALITEPEEVSVFLNSLADFWIEIMQRMSKYIHFDMVCLTEHMATGNGPLMSPATYRKVLKPIHKRFYDAITDIGAINMIHCDGFIEPLLSDFADLGVKVIRPFQIFNDINRLKLEYGFIAVGGWDCFGRGNQSDSTEEEARASVRNAIDSYSPGNHYVFLQAGAAPSFKKSLEWIADEARIYGRAIYQNN